MQQLARDAGIPLKLGTNPTFNHCLSIGFESSTRLTTDSCTRCSRGHLRRRLGEGFGFTLRVYDRKRVRALLELEANGLLQAPLHAQERRRESRLRRVTYVLQESIIR